MLPELRSNDQPEESVENTPEKEKVTIHEVEAGETLWAISRKYHLTIEELRAWNGLKDSDPINPGQKLLLQAPVESFTRNADAKTKTYRVKAGDSLYKIAKEHNMTVEELMTLNNLKDSSLSVGQELKVKQ